MNQRHVGPDIAVLVPILVELQFCEFLTIDSLGEILCRCRRRRRAFGPDSDFEFNQGNMQFVVGDQGGATNSLPIDPGAVGASQIADK